MTALSVVAPTPRRHFRTTLKRYLLAWTLGPIGLFMAIDAASLYYSALQTAAAAHDRLLQATAQQIADLLRVDHDTLSVSVPLALVEALEGTGGSRMYFRVIGLDGRHVAGDPDLPPPAGPSVDRPLHYVARVGAETLHVTALHQPVEASQGHGVALILVGETLEARKATAAVLLRDVLVRQFALALVIAGVVWLVVRRAVAPLAALRDELRSRNPSDTARLAAQGPEELLPVIEEMNGLFGRQQEWLQHQQRFIADASHQLRTPLAVLKTQLQSALHGDAPLPLALSEMLRTVDRTTHLANQLLSKARLSHGAGEDTVCELDMREVAQEAVLELSPLIAARHLACTLESSGAICVRGNRWMAGELVRNLLSNAIRHTPDRGDLGLRLRHRAGGAELVVWDSGSGLGEGVRAWLFQPFAAGKDIRGAGLGLAICLDIARSMKGHIELVNRCADDGTVLGLDAVVRWDDEVADGSALDVHIVQ